MSVNSSTGKYQDQKNDKSSKKHTSSFISPGREVAISVLKGERLIFPSRLDQPRCPGSIEPYNNASPPTRSQWDPDNTLTIKMGLNLEARTNKEIEDAKRSQEEEKV